LKKSATKAPHPIPRVRSNAPVDDLLIRKELKSNSTLRTCVVSLVGIAFSVALVYLGVIWRNNNTMTNFLPVVGEVPGIIAELLIALGGALFTIFAISLIWELFVRRSWLREMRNYIFMTLCSPQASNYSDTTDWQMEILGQIMTNLSSDKVSEFLHHRFQNEFFSPQRTRKNFNYEVVLSEIDEAGNPLSGKFFKASIEFKFHTLIAKSDFSRKVRLVYRENSSDLADSYYQSLEDFDNDIYRYIFLTSKDSSYFTTPVLTVTSCRMKHKRTSIALTVTKSSDEDNVTIVAVSDKDKRGFNDFVGEECEISFTIETYVDKQYSFYPMIFGYPIDHFTTKLSICSGDVSGVYIVPFFNSDESFNLDGTGKYNGTSWAAGHINHLSLPSSSLVYVWNYCTGAAN